MSEARRAAEHCLNVHGWSVVPIKAGEKRPAISWQEYQERLPTEDELASWFTNGEGVGVVTGRLSDVVVFDADGPEGIESVESRIPDSLVTPISTTPGGGRHYFFRWPHELVRNGVRIAPGLDFRGDGGLVVIPPAPGRQWLEGLSPDDLALAEIPEGLRDLLSSNTTLDTPAANRLRTVVQAQSPPDAYTRAALEAEIEAVKTSQVGYRNHRLNIASFNLGQLIATGAIDESTVETALTAAAQAAGLAGSEVRATIKSGIESGLKQPRDLSSIPRPLGTYKGVYINKPVNGDVNGSVIGDVNTDSLSAQIGQWISLEPGRFTTSDLDHEFNLRTRNEKINRSVILNRLMKRGLVEHVSGRKCHYRTVDKNEVVLDWLNIENTGGIDLAWPLGLEEYFEILPGSIIVVAGSSNAGKTAFCLETVRLNMNRFEVFYFASSAEVNARTLHRRIEKFGQPLDSWNFKAIARPQGNFHQVIRPEALNVIDYLEVHTDFYEIGGLLTSIHEVLTDGVAVVSLQKNPDAEFARGGALTMDKATAYLALDRGPIDRQKPNTLRIVKAKYPRGESDCNGRIIRFKLVGGAQFKEVSKA